MAETFAGYYAGVAFAATKNMAALINQHATEKLKIREIALSNAQTAGVTGVVCSMELRHYVSGTLTTPTNGTLFEFDSANTAPTTYVLAYAGTIGGTPTSWWSWIWSSDEAAASSATSDELECFTPLNIVYSWIPHSDVQPWTLNQNDMAMVYNVSGAAGLLHTRIIFTKE